MSNRLLIPAVIALCCTALSPQLFRSAWAQTTSPTAPQPQPPADKAASDPTNRPQSGGFGNLVLALNNTPGCLGTETARTTSGKQVIFAWFANKKAAQTWYNSKTHQGLMGMMGGASRPPLQGVTDEKTPIMVIASLTPTSKPNPATGLPVSQIAIELYAPITGGFAMNGRFAPDKMKVDGMSTATSPAPAK